jgi:hypothetical protein
VAVRTTLLASGRRTDATTVVIYTCPDGTTTIVKDVRVVNLSTSATLDLVIAMDAGSFNQTLWYEAALAPRAVVHLEVWQVMLPAMELAIRGDVDGSLNYWISGTELDGIAP